ncbi:type I glyceraldehyde-3-phosphate dehydrogenase [Anaplasmataceae bacterium AB001_6]|nr:type I glyceraldehyde-3-phosphate dehydrogenase [Anaplasmataceae bacterium AB001_6]
MKIAINGLGRIGRCVLRNIFSDDKKNLSIDSIAINTPSSIDTAIHLLKYDSVHGISNLDISKDDDNTLIINGNKINYSRERDISNLPWNDHNIDFVLDCSGRFNSKEKLLNHIKNGAKKVIASAPVKEADRTIIYGINNDQIESTDKIISVGSCTTNCLAPMIKVLEEHFKIINGYFTTIHSYTNDQNVLDNSHTDLRRARSCGMSIVPTKTGASETIFKIFPNLKNKICGSAIRVPTPNISLIDAVFNLAKDVNIADIHSAFNEYSKGVLSKILGFSNDLKVSVDFMGNTCSAVYDVNETHVINNGKTVRILCWYDNEWAFSCRMLDVLGLLNRA